MEQGAGQISGLMDMDMEKLLEESVPCRVRAKRGCATHPRSIAERVRFFFSLYFEKRKRKERIYIACICLILLLIFL